MSLPSVDPEFESLRKLGLARTCWPCGGTGINAHFGLPGQRRRVILNAVRLQRFIAAAGDNPTSKRKLTVKLCRACDGAGYIDMTRRPE